MSDLEAAQIANQDAQRALEAAQRALEAAQIALEVAQKAAQDAQIALKVALTAPRRICDECDTLFVGVGPTCPPCSEDLRVCTCGLSRKYGCEGIDPHELVDLPEDQCGTCWRCTCKGDSCPNSHDGTCGQFLAGNTSRDIHICTKCYSG
jgi:hypothetical protein